jgi:hypothetical protein
MEGPVGVLKRESQPGETARSARLRVAVNGGSADLDERSFPRTFASLADIFAFTTEFFGREAIAETHRFAVDFAIEELFTNMVKYNAGNPHQIRIGLQKGLC